MIRASLVLVILYTLCGCLSTPEVPSEAKTSVLQLPTFNLPEVLKVRTREGYAVVRDLKRHPAGARAKVFRKGVQVGVVMVESARRQSFLIVSIESGILKSGDTLKFIE